MDFLLCCVLLERIGIGREGRGDKCVINMSAEKWGKEVENG